MRTIILLAFIFVVLAGSLIAFPFLPPLPLTGQTTYAGLERDYLTPATFQHLPSLPGDFSQVVEEMKSRGREVKDLGEEYYKQPEFFPTFSYYIPLMENPREYWGVIGYGAFPSDVKVSAGRGEITVATIFHTSWLVETYQGMRLEAVMDEGTEEFFEVSIEPSILLLEPAYPVFGEHWAQKVTVHVKLKNPPKGRYTIGLNPFSPPQEFSEKWSSQYEKYTEVGGFGVGRPLFQITLDII